MSYPEIDFTALRALIEESPTPIGLYAGPEMRVLFANKAMAVDTWGKDLNTIGKTLTEALPELEGQPFHQILDNVYNTGKTYRATEDLVKLVVNGQLQAFYYNFTYKPLINNEGKVWGILNTATNVTDLVMARKRADEAESQLSFSLDAAEIGTWDLDISTQTVSWSARTQELYGFAKEDTVTYDDVLKHIHPEDRLLVDRAVTLALDPNAGAGYDIKFRTIGANDNQLRWLRCKGKAYFDEQGVPQRFSGIALDITTETAADERINSAEQLAKLALETAEAGSYLIHLPDDTITYTPLFAKVLTGSETLGLSRQAFINYVHPADVAVRERAYERSLQTGKLFYEARFVWDDNTVHWVRITGRYIYDNQEKPVTFAGLAQDITQETEAKQEQHKLLWLIENSNDFISLSNWMGNLTYLNKAGRQMLGLANIEDAQQYKINYLAPEESQKIDNVINPALLADGRWSGQLNYRNIQTGETIPGYTSSLLLTDAINGSPVGKASIIRDLRPEIANQKALTESEELFRAITTASPAALWMTDTEGMITYVNQIWINWTGKPLNEHLGTGWLNSVWPDDLETVVTKFTSDFNERGYHDSQFKLNHIDGTYRWIACTGNPQYTADGSFKGYIGACVDITDQKQLQQQKDEFIGVASHELKTPVTSLKAYAQVLQVIFTREGDIKKAAMLGKMNSQIDRLTSLIGDLLDVTKIQSGRLQFNDDYFDFNQLITELTEDLQRTTDKHQLLLELQPTGLAYADKDRISQVITNLISNAIKYSPLANKVLVKTSIEDNEILLCVQDFGIGINADKKDRVFEQFYRVSGDKQHTFPGLGLGLYISSEIIKREGGRIWVNSFEDEGSTFCFALPLKS
jgi:PAS domain S-box-containing protein